MSTLFLPGIFRAPLKSSRMINLLFQFLSLTHFLIHLLTSFRQCFSSLGVFLLSSLSLRISASLTKMSSLTFAAADAVARVSMLSFLISLVPLLKWNTIEPRQRCGQDGVHLSLLLSDMLLPHLFIPSIKRRFGSRFPASSSHPPRPLLPPQV